MITSYEFDDPRQERWHIHPTKLGKVNLLVGTSGSGKTRFLNTFFNFSHFVAVSNRSWFGNWKISFITEGCAYTWIMKVGLNKKNDRREVLTEQLIKNPDNNRREILIDRTQVSFKFCNKELPKLPGEKPSVWLLKEEEKIQPIYKLFSHVLRQNFSGYALIKAKANTTLHPSVIKSFEKSPDIETLWSGDFPLGARMYLLENYFPNKYELAMKFFKKIFPTVKGALVGIMENSPLEGLPEGIMPFFKVREKGVKPPIPLKELSSGMQKVLLIITEILSLPEGSIYLIDEYENSLGINAIDFLPEFLIDHGGENQYLITTHHPYLINKMPMRYWRVFNRRGSDVYVKPGSEFEERFGKSKQKAFIQLLNDPFYSEGVL